MIREVPLIHRRLQGFLVLTTLCVMTLATARAQRPSMAMPEVPWEQILPLARSFVEQESPAKVWPFERVSAQARTQAPAKVFIHYFPPYPISFDNKPAGADFWTSGYLSRDGERGKHANVGGFTRQRPLPTRVWDSPYWREINAAIDVLRAHAMGADGFGVDIVQLGEGAYWDQARRICAAATALHIGFSFVPEIDASILSKASVDQIVDITATLTTCPASYRLADGRYLFVPFAPMNETPAYWAEVQKKLAARGIRLAFVPDLLGQYAQQAAEWAPISAGMTFWGWKDLTQASSAATVAAEHKAASLVPFWMQPIATQDDRPAASLVWEAGNTQLLRTLWSQAIEAKYPYAHLITWNDYGEGTEFAPSSGSQFVFYDLSAYYIEQFKTGRPPPITADAIYYTYRPEMFDPHRPAAPGDKPMQSPGPTPISNEVEMVAMLRAPATLRIQLAGQTVNANVGAGLLGVADASTAGHAEFPDPARWQAGGADRRGLADRPAGRQGHARLFRRVQHAHAGLIVSPAGTG